MPFKVVTEFTGVAGSPYFNTLVFAGSGATDAQAAATAARAFWAALQGNLADTLRGQVQLEVVEFQISDGASIAVWPVTSAQIVYTASNTMLPRATQGLVRLRTGFFAGGREVRGRIFIPCLTEIANDIGVPSAAIITTVNTAVATMISGSADLLVYSPALSATASVTAGSMWSEWASLRSRRD
jgi:hypothetical protein